MISANPAAVPRFNRGPITVSEWEWNQHDPDSLRKARAQSTPDSSKAQQPRDPKYFSMTQLANRWQCSRGSVYNRLRRAGAEVLDFAPRGKRGRKAISLQVVQQIESRYTKRLW